MPLRSPPGPPATAMARPAIHTATLATVIAVTTAIAVAVITAGASASSAAARPLPTSGGHAATPAAMAAAAPTPPAPAPARASGSSTPASAQPPPSPTPSATSSVASSPGSSGSGRRSTSVPAPDGQASPTPPVSGSPTPGVSPTPPPSPSSSPSPGSSPGPGAGGCGAFDVPCKVGAAIDGWFRGLVRAAVNPVIAALGTSVLASPRVDRMGRVVGLWSASVLIANACFVVLVMAAGILVMSHGSVQTSYTAKDMAPRLVVALVAANTSLLVVGEAIEAGNGLSAALLGQGVPVDQAAQRLKSFIGEILLLSIVGKTPLYLVLLALIAVAMALALVAIYVVRVMMLTLLTAAAPLALACHALPHTDALARLWWRALFGVLGIQVTQALVMITALRVFFTSAPVLFGHRQTQGLFDLLLIICLLYVLIRIPAWITRLIFHTGRGPLQRITDYTLAAIVLRRARSRRRRRRR